VKLINSVGLKPSPLFLKVLNCLKSVDNFDINLNKEIEEQIREAEKTKMNCKPLKTILRKVRGYSNSRQPQLKESKLFEFERRCKTLQHS
jgi:hypothetical protein